MTDSAEKKDSTEKKMWFGRGVYRSKDVPIRILDGMIIGGILLVIFLMYWFATHSGYRVTFETDGGTEVEAQTLKYGELAEEPQNVTKPGYDLVCWMTSEDESLADVWDFGVDEVTGDQTLYAVWKAAEITIKFDLDGGTYEDSATIADRTVTFGETYGELPVPEKEGYRFDGWVYSGAIISADTEVTMTGEHILTARWVLEE